MKRVLILEADDAILEVYKDGYKDGYNCMLKGKVPEVNTEPGT